MIARKLPLTHRDLIVLENLGINGGFHGLQLPAISQSDLFDGGTVPADELALHGQGTINLDIVWTADQDYESVFANYVYNRVGDNGAPNTGSSTLTILGTAGVSLAQTNVAATGSTAPSLGGSCRRNRNLSNHRSRRRRSFGELSN